MLSLPRIDPTLPFRHSRTTLALRGKNKNAADAAPMAARADVSVECVAEPEVARSNREIRRAADVASRSVRPDRRLRAADCCLECRHRHEASEKPPRR